METAIKYNSHDTTNSNCVCFAKPEVRFAKKGNSDSIINDSISVNYPPPTPEKN